MSDDLRATTRRKCAKCGQVAVACVHVTQHLLNGVLPIGRTYVHRCNACNAEFETESPFRSAYNFGWGLLMLGIGALGSIFTVSFVLGIIDGAPWPSVWQTIGTLIMPLVFLVGLYLPVRTVIRGVHLFRNPAG